MSAAQLNTHKKHQLHTESGFYYFAYGSCMCPVDLKRSLGEDTHNFVIGTATLKDYHIGFYRKSPSRNCGTLDVVKTPGSRVEGVLYHLPWRVSEALDLREEVPRGGYRHEMVNIHCQNKLYQGVRTYVVVNKLDREMAPNDWYFQVVLRGAVTCGLSEEYCWKLFNHMHQLQRKAS
ncbi:gamma-glutamylcyclotransferase [Moorena producens]|uniref:gamma-glutamylcyclotransferase n=1 Tax=Moorena producens TaxID=1155739 RepID=UPI003C710C6C